MPKRNTLNGIPGNLALSYFSTNNYYNGGYKADWLFQIALNENLPEIVIDIIGKKIFPEIASIPALLDSLDFLKNIMNKELENNGFEISFIKDAKMSFSFEKNQFGERIVYCSPYLKDINDRIYKPKKQIIEFAELKELKYN